MRFDFKKHLIQILVVLCIANFALFIVLFIKIDQVEKERIDLHSFDERMSALLDEKYEQRERSNSPDSDLNVEQELEQLKMDLASISVYDLGDINARLSRLEIIGDIWTESVINQNEVKLIYGKVVSKDYFQQLKTGVPIIAKGSDEAITYQLRDDFQSYAVGQYGLVMEFYNERFVQSVVLNDDFDCTYVLVNDEIKYIIMGAFPE